MLGNSIWCVQIPKFRRQGGVTPSSSLLHGSGEASHCHPKTNVWLWAWGGQHWRIVYYTKWQLGGAQSENWLTCVQVVILRPLRPLPKVESQVLWCGKIEISYNIVSLLLPNYLLKMAGINAWLVSNQNGSKPLWQGIHNSGKCTVPVLYESFALFWDFAIVGLSIFKLHFAQKKCFALYETKTTK